MKQITSVKFTFTNVCKIIPEKQKKLFPCFFKQKINDLANRKTNDYDIIIYLSKIHF